MRVVSPEPTGQVRVTAFESLFQEPRMLKFLASTVGIIFLIGLLVIIGLLMLIF